jgi:hypothetical protein
MQVQTASSLVERVLQAAIQMERHLRSDELRSMRDSHVAGLWSEDRFRLQAMTRSSKLSFA